MNSEPRPENHSAWSSSAWDDYIEAQRDYEVSVQRKYTRNAELVFHACALWLYRRGLLLEHEDMRFRPAPPPDATPHDASPRQDSECP
jgi:hypothetical protein